MSIKGKGGCWHEIHFLSRELTVNLKKGKAGSLCIASSHKMTALPLQKPAHAPHFKQ